jgi:hypothetical protein
VVGLGNAIEIALTCRQCGKQFIFSSSEQEFYRQKGFNPPKHCLECRALRRASPVLCARCGQKQDGNTVVFCAACQESVRLELASEVQRSQRAFEDLSLQLDTAMREKNQLADTLSAQVAALESAQIQGSRDNKVKIAALESAQTRLREAEQKLGAALAEKESLASLLAQEKQARADLQAKLNTARVELDQALKDRVVLDSLGPSLINIRAALESLGRNQEVISQTLQQWAREASETPQNGNLFESIKRFLRLGPKTTSPAN